MLSAGAAKVDITPKPGVALAGSFRPVISTSIHDPLHTRALAIDDGLCPLILATCDLIAIERADVLAAKEIVRQKTGVPPQNILLAGIHTHSAPAPSGLLGTDREDAYMTWAVARMADAMIQAWQTRRRARLGWASAAAPEHLFNRRFRMKDGSVRMNPGVLNPDVIEPVGPIDPQIVLLAAIDAATAQPIAAMGSYALHYVGGGEGGAVSADYFACVETALNNRINHAFPVIWANAFSGDVNNVDVMRPRPEAAPWQRMNQVADSVAAHAAAAWKSIAFTDLAPLAAALQDLPCRRRANTPEELAQARALLAQPPGPAQNRELDRDRVYARDRLILADWPEVEPVPVQALRIGDLGIAALPGEIFTQYGLDLKARSPFPLTMNIELANGYVGYVPTLAGFEQGGYETWLARSSRLEPQAGPAMTELAIALLHQVHGASS